MKTKVTHEDSGASAACDMPYKKSINESAQSYQFSHWVTIWSVFDAVQLAQEKSEHSIVTVGVTVK